MGSILRSPLGMFVAILVVGFAVIAVGMTAFGGTSSSPSYGPKPLTSAQFKREGARLSRSLCLQLKPIVNKKPHSLRGFASGLARITVVFDRFRTGFDRLVPPASHARSFYRFRNKLDGAVYEWDRANHLAATHQWGSFLRLVRSKSWKRMKRQLGGTTKGKLSCGHARHAKT
jgi:hypothetical protein